MRVWEFYQQAGEVWVGNEGKTLTHELLYIYPIDVILKLNFIKICF